MLTRYSIVGAKHRGFDPYLAGTMPGTPVVLIREPDNKFDKNAVMVWIDGKHVGYVPSKNNASLAADMDSRIPPGRPPLALDSKIDDATRAAIKDRAVLVGRFARSPNSAFPLVEIGD